MLIASEHASGLVRSARSHFQFSGKSLINRVVIAILLIFLMTLLVHLRVLAVRRLGVTVVRVTTRTAVRNGGKNILCHALRETGTVCAVLRSS